MHFLVDYDFKLVNDDEMVSKRNNSIVEGLISTNEISTLPNANLIMSNLKSCSCMSKKTNKQTKTKTKFKSTFLIFQLNFAHLCICITICLEHLCISLLFKKEQLDPYWVLVHITFFHATHYFQIELPTTSIFP